jgi:two-component system sensor histidine kinase BaeS
MSRGRPLDRVGAIKLKLGAMVVGGVVVSVLVVLGGAAAGIPTWLNVVVAFALALVAVDLLGSGLTAPLRQMARQADRLASGLPVEPVDEVARDEVGDLARAFNRMAHEVAHTDRVRRDLVANVSHELRTPLAALTAVLENVIDGVEEAGPDALGRMQDQVDRLRRRVVQLLDLSQLDAGAVTIDRGPVRVATLVRECVAGLDHAGGQRVVIEVDPDLEAWLDRDRFAQVVVNLVGNALRHGPAATQVTVTAVEVATVEARGQLRLTIRDEGPGIAVEDAARVFERFARADDGRAATIGGTGLGLAITRWIVELHEGTVHVDRPGQPGGRLVVELPMTAPGTLLPPPDPSHGASVAIADAPPAAVSGGSLDVLRVLPTPIAGLRWRAVAAAFAAGVVMASLVTLVGGPFTNLGVAISLVFAAGAVLVAVERPLDAYAKACAGIGVAIGAAWALTDTAWLLVPLTLGAIPLAGLGLWGPRTFGQHLRALVVGPVLMVATPVALVRSERRGRRGATSPMVPMVATGVVLLVFGTLLAGVDGVFARLLGAVLPDIDIDGTLILRILLGVLTAAVVVTYVLVQRAGTVETAPWARPVRPKQDWAIPVGALVALFAAFVAVQIGTLFGGDALIQRTLGLTYAEHARSGFGQLVLVALLTLVVLGIVVRVADDADRRLRDIMLGALVGLTFVMLASAVHRLVLYVDAFGLTRPRLSGLAILTWIAAMLVLAVVAASVRRFAPHLPRTAVVVTGVLALAFLASRPDVIIAETNIARWERTGSIDTWYLASLSADAVPTIASSDVAERMARETGAFEVIAEEDRPACFARMAFGDVVGGYDDGDRSWQEWNLARVRARAAIVDAFDC